MTLELRGSLPQRLRLLATFNKGSDVYSKVMLEAADALEGPVFRPVSESGPGQMPHATEFNGGAVCWCGEDHNGETLVEAVEAEVALGRELAAYIDKWVAVGDHHVAASADSLDGLLVLIGPESDVDACFRVPSPAKAVWL